MSNGTLVKWKRPFIRGADGLTEALRWAEGGRTQSWLTSRTQKYPVTLLKHSKRLQHADACKPWWWLGTGPAHKTKLSIWNSSSTWLCSLGVDLCRETERRVREISRELIRNDQFFGWKARLKQIKSRWFPTYAPSISGGRPDLFGQGPKNQWFW